MDINNNLGIGTEISKGTAIDYRPYISPKIKLSIKEKIKEKIISICLNILEKFGYELE